MSDTLLWTVTNGVGTCQFNRPNVRNALNRQMVHELSLLVVEITARDDIQFVVFTGNNQAFISGADIEEMEKRGRSDALDMINTGLFRQIELLTKPTIAAIEGDALGGGCELAMACDLRVCGASAKLGQPEVKLGIIPGAGATYRLARLVGIGRAKELIYTGRMIDAQTALQMGLVNRVVADGEATASAHTWIDEMREASPLALHFAKLALNGVHELSTDRAMAFEATAQAVLFEDAEKKRRMRAFVEKRKKKP